MRWQSSLHLNSAVVIYEIHIFIIASSSLPGTGITLTSPIDINVLTRSALVLESKRFFCFTRYKFNGPSTVPVPYFSRKIVEIERFALRAARVFSYLGCLTWR